MIFTSDDGLFDTIDDVDDVLKPVEFVYDAASASAELWAQYHEHTHSAQLLSASYLDHKVEEFDRRRFSQDRASRKKGSFFLSDVDGHSHHSH